MLFQVPLAAQEKGDKAPAVKKSPAREARSSLNRRPATPPVKGVANDETYTGVVRPHFRAPAGVVYKATISRNSGKIKPFKSGTPVFKPGDYLLTVRARSNKSRKSSTAVLNFTIKKASIAILDFEIGGGADKSLSRSLSELMKSNILNTRLFQVVERSKIDEVLKEQAFQQSGLCADTSCAVKIGQMLAANKMMTGTVNKTSGGFVLSIRIIDVEKNKLDFAHTVRFRNLQGLEKILLGATVKITARIMGVDESNLVEKRPPRTPHIWRSLVFPGWGQYHEGSRVKGMSFMISFSLMLGASLQSVADIRGRQREYDSLLGAPSLPGSGSTYITNYMIFQGARERLQDARRRSNIMLGITALIWLANAGDIVFLPRKTGGEGSASARAAENKSLNGYFAFFPETKTGALQRVPSAFFAPRKRFGSSFQMGLRFRY